MHEKYIDMISQAVDQEISQKETKELQAHLVECEECCQYYTLFTTLDNTLTAHQEEPPGQLHAAIMNTIRNEKKKESPAGWLKRYRFTAAAAAAALVILATAYAGPFFDENYASVDSPSPESSLSSEEIHGGDAAALMRAMPAPADERQDTSAQWTLPHSTSFTDIRIKAMEAAGYSGSAVILTGISSVELSEACPSHILENGETVYELTPDQLSLLTAETSAEILETYAPNGAGNSTLYWVFIA